MRVCLDFNVKCVHAVSVLTLSPLSSSLLGSIHASISGFCFYQLCTLCLPLWPLLSPSPADGASHLKRTDYNHLRKVEMWECSNLSPSLIATICCSSSLQELVVTSSRVSVLSVCLTTPCIQTAFYCNFTAPQNHASTFVWLHLMGEGPFLSNSSVPGLLACLAHINVCLLSLPAHLPYISCPP